YELTMMAGYFGAGMNGRATFELFVRDLPPNRAFLVAAGLEQAIDYLDGLRFEREEIDYLRSLANLGPVAPLFFADYLPRVRFTGDVRAVAEGTPVFAHEPIVQVTAPIGEAQLVETALLATVNFQTSVATKAARVVEAAAGRPVLEFGSRRAHGIEAACLAARAACLAGCVSTSNVEAGFRFGVPLSGTMAHSWVMSFADEIDAFREYSSLFGDKAVLLIDTYASVAAARRIVETGMRPPAVRIDSGDLAAVISAVRSVFDEAGLTETRILASGDLDEYRIEELLRAGMPVDGFGVGTSVSTSKDAPALGGIYKLVEIERAGRWVPLLKRSPGKPGYPARKQAWRVLDRGQAVEDVLGVEGEAPPPGGEPLLRPVMAGGRRLLERRPVMELREDCLRAVGTLPPTLRVPRPSAEYPIRISPALQRLADQLSLDPRQAAQ
ncbi:MAG: nicotinate phosphoribosyltransferase, partial [Acidobacteria bacterium]